MANSRVRLNLMNSRRTLVYSYMSKAAVIFSSR